MTKLKYILFLVFASTLSFEASAQFAERIASGRPGNANGAFSVGKGVYQVQFGQNFITTNNSLSDNYKGNFPSGRVFSGPDVIFRIGLKETSELRIGGVYSLSEEVKFDQGIPNQSFSGLCNFIVGIRSTLFMQKGILPATAIQFTTDFGGSSDYDKKLPDAGFRVNFSNRIGEKLNLNWNFISRWVPDNADIVGFYIFSFSYPITDDLAITAEAFGNIDETTKLNTGLGLSYLIGSNFQIDAYGSYGRNEIERGNVERDHQLQCWSFLSNRES